MQTIVFNPAFITINGHDYPKTPDLRYYEAPDWSDVEIKDHKTGKTLMHRTGYAGITNPATGAAYVSAAALKASFEAGFFLLRGQLYDNAGVISVDANKRWLYDYLGNKSVDWQGKVVYHWNGTRAIFWDDNRNSLYDNGGNIGIVWASTTAAASSYLNIGYERVLMDGNVSFLGHGAAALDWKKRLLLDSGENIAVDWENRTLHGFSAPGQIGNLAARPTVTFKTGLGPRQVTQVERLALTMDIASDLGCMVYQTDGTEGLYIYKSTGWHFIA